MSSVTKTNVYGPREIAPESLWPGLTRFNTAVGSWHPIQKRILGSKALSGSGIWLPLPDSSQEDFNAISKKVRQVKSGDDLLIGEGEFELAKSFFEHTEVTDDGCWVGTDDSHALRLISELDTRHKILEDDDNFEDIRQCDNPSCQYHRHYDFSFDVPSGRRELVYPNEEFYRETTDGVITAWGDLLPEIDVSRDNLKAFREQSLPFVKTHESLLTANGISQICLVPSTGCWFVRMYYMTPTGEASPKGWQYDGYGRLRVPSRKAKEHNYIKYSTLAHRIVWLVSGRPLADSKKFVLNHKCGFRPCANPDHLEEMTPQENNIHGLMMDISSRMTEGRIDIDSGIEQLIKLSKMIDYNPDLFLKFWT